MATNFPTSLDTFTNPTSGNTLDSPSHSGQHSDINDAVEAIEAKLGVGSSTAGSATAGYALVNTSAGTTAYSLLGVAGISSGTATSGQVLTANGSGGVSFGNGGLTLINTTSFTTVSSQSINNVFSSTYRNYLIILNPTGTGNNDIYLRFRASSTDTTANYYRSGIEMVYSTTTVTGNNTNNGTFLYIGSTYSSSLSSTHSVIISQPNLVDRTEIQYQNYGNDRFHIGAGFVNDTTQYDGFTIYPNTGTITGSLSVYGYNK